MITERRVPVGALKVGDLIKSYVEFIPPMRVARAPQPRQHGVDYDTDQGTHYARHEDVVTVLDLAVPDPGWGAPYGGLAYWTQGCPGTPLWMFRKGQRVRFYGPDGQQVGPEQANVAPAVAYAHSKRWLIAS
jgi:hypothetical protein